MRNLLRALVPLLLLLSFSTQAAWVHKGFVNDSDGGATCVTNSVTFTSGSLGVASVLMLEGGLTTASTPTVTGGGYTWTKRQAVQYATDWILFVYTGAGTPSAGVITVSAPGGDHVACSVSVEEEDSGSTQTSGNPVVQAPTPTTGTSSPASITLAAFGNTNNRAFSVAAVEGSGALTPDATAGWGELYDDSGVFGTGLHVQGRMTEDTTVQVTGVGAGDPWAIIGLELAQASASPTLLLRRRRN
jgi:hypothetical protein